MKSNPNRTAATRQNLIDAFCILLKHKSVEKITIREISDKAGYNRCTFYQYFEDVYDILDCVEDILLAHIKENFRKNISPDNFEQTFFQAFTAIHNDKSVYFDILFAPTNRARFFERLFTEVSPIFMETFKLSPTNLKSKYLTKIYLQTVVSGVLNWLKDGRPFPVEELSKFLRDILTTGVLTELSRIQITEERIL